MVTENSKKESSAAKRAARRVLINAILAREVTKLAILTYSVPLEKRWQIVTFLGPLGQEGNRIIDMLAIRKKTTDDDLEIILLDIKTSEIKPKKIDEKDTPRLVENENIPRLIAVSKHHSAKNIVHAAYQKNTMGEYELKFWELKKFWKKTDSEPWIKKDLKDILK